MSILISEKTFKYIPKLHCKINSQNKVKTIYLVKNSTCICFVYQKYNRKSVKISKNLPNKRKELNWGQSDRLQKLRRFAGSTTRATPDSPEEKRARKGRRRWAEIMGKWRLVGTVVESGGFWR